jgi:hypothetical protein
MLYCLTTSGLNKTLGTSSGGSTLVSVLASLLSLSSLGLWVLSDARERERNLPYDFDSFVFFAWPVVVLTYLFSTRGWRAFATIGWFLLLYLIAMLVTY